MGNPTPVVARCVKVSRFSTSDTIWESRTCSRLTLPRTAHASRSALLVMKAFDSFAKHVSRFGLAVRR